MNRMKTLKKLNLHTYSVPWLFPSLVLIILFAVRIVMLFQSSWPNGLDGAFYAMEFRSVMERGHLENPDYSPVFYIGGAISRIISDPVAGVKITSALFSTLIAAGLFFFVKMLFPDSSKRAEAAALLAALSPSLAKMSVNYINNLAGLAFGLFTLAFSVRFIKTKRIHSLLPAILMLIAAVLSHRVSAAFLFAIAILFGLTRLWNRSGKKVRLGGIIVLLLLIATMALTFRWQDYRRFSGNFSLGPGLPILSSVFRRQLPIAIGIEISAYFVLTYLVSGYALFQKTQRKAAVILAPLFFFPFWNLKVLDMGYRMLLSSIPAGIFFITAIPISKTAMPAKLPSFLKWVLLPFIFLTIPVYSPKTDPPYEQYHQVIASVELPEDSLLIAHLGLNHIYTFDKNFRDALNYIPDFPVPGNRIWRLAHNVSYEMLEMIYPDEAASGQIQPLPHNYTLIKEDLWQRYLLWEDEDIVETLKTWYNPFNARPEFIR